MIRKMIPIALSVCLLLTGCSAQPEKRELFAMDTVIGLTVYAENGQTPLDEAEAEIRRLEAMLSVTDPSSEIARINTANGAQTPVSAELIELLKACRDYSDQTNRLFDVTVYPIVKAWGFTTDRHQIPSDEQLAALLPLVDMDAVTLADRSVSLKPGMALDPGAVAKGYAADRVAALWRKSGASGVLSLGGNVVTVGSKPDGSPFSVGVQDPAGNGMLTTLSVEGGTAVVTSGDYQRYFEENGRRYHHIIDPRTGKPAESGLTSVTVIAPCAAEADAFATALFIMGLDDGLAFVRERENLEAIFVTKDHRAIITPGLWDRLTDQNSDFTFEQG